MILGRTPEGLIKIKTDEEGGGLRAVECACCGEAVCGCSSVSATLKQIIESATMVSVNGASVAWNGNFAQRQPDENPLYFIISYESGTICVYADEPVFAMNTAQLAPEPLFCPLTPFSVIGFITINGVEFRSYFAFPNPWTVSVVFS